MYRTVETAEAFSGWLGVIVAATAGMTGGATSRLVRHCNPDASAAFWEADR